MKKFLFGFFSSMLSVSMLCASSDILISAEDAVKLIGKPGVMFVSGDDDSIFKTGHIKGSVEMYAHHLHHTDVSGHMECAPLFMCPKEAEEYIGSKGIDNDTLVIAYDNFRGPNATGVYAFFKSWGHEKIKILNGGRSAIMKLDPEQKVYDAIKEDLRAAQKAKEPQEKIDALKDKLAEQDKKLLVLKGDGEKIEHKKYAVDLQKINYDYIAGKNELLDAVKDILKNGKDSKYVIIDARGFTEIMGDKKLDNVARGGHIPGAKFIEWKHLTDFDNELSYKKLDELQKLFDQYGITKDKKIYAYCHVGAGRSTHVITALEMLGYPDAKVYTGSWDEWGNDMNLPIKR
jgi:thiosulfate/3-mercaptopyruvate sulfurtransferase